MKVSGWTESSLSSFVATIPVYIEWREKEVAEIPFPCPCLCLGSSASASSEILCFTGFRDAALEAAASAKGHHVTDKVTGKTTLLVIPDGDHAATSKEKTAKEKGIRVVSKSVFLSQYI
jgi:NAD-dependent DNA ligase